VLAEFKTAIYHSRSTRSIAETTGYNYYKVIHICHIECSYEVIHTTLTDIRLHPIYFRTDAQIQLQYFKKIL